MLKMFTAVLLFSVSLSTLAETPLRFATTANNPPFEYQNEQGDLVGFDIDLSKALCERMKRQCTFTSNNFERLLPSLKFRRFDAVISGLDITESRLEEVDFTQSYYANSATLIAAKGRFTDIEQLKGKRVGVGNVTVQQDYLQAAWPDIVSVVYDNYQNALLDMQSGRLDGIFGDTPAIMDLLPSWPALEKVGKPINDSHYFGKGLGIAVRKGNTELLEELNTALQSIKEDGTLEKIRAHWLDSSTRN